MPLPAEGQHIHPGQERAAKPAVGMLGVAHTGITAAPEGAGSVRSSAIRALVVSKSATTAVKPAAAGSVGDTTGDGMGEGGARVTRCRDDLTGENSDRRSVTWAAALHRSPNVCALGLMPAPRKPGRNGGWGGGLGKGN
jgi:hypothetical protein